MSIEAMKQVVKEAVYHRGGYWIVPEKEFESLRQAIAEAEKQDKFCDDNCAWTDHHKDCVRASVSWKDMAFARLGVVRDKMHPDDVATVQRFLDGDYTHPQPKREPLTDEQIAEFFGVKAVDESFVDFVRAIEAAHGIKK